MHAFLIMLLVHLHLTVLEPVIKDAFAVARNPIVRKEVKAAAKAVSSYEQHKKNGRNK